MSIFTPQQSSFFAHRITLEGLGEEALSQSLSTARVDMNPHQVDAALFALASPLSKGVVLADEVGLGKTIEASLVIAQRWAERRRRILLIVPASLRKQWQQELREKFSLPSRILDARTARELVKEGETRPFDTTDAIVLTSYEFAARHADQIAVIAWDLVIFDEAHRMRNVYKKSGSPRAPQPRPRPPARHADQIAVIAWDLVIFDEAHRMRNVYKKSGSARAKALRDALSDRFKILLTATPLQNSLLELFGLVSVIDGTFFG